MNKEPMMEAYEAPQVRVIEVEVEKGFAVSSGNITASQWTSVTVNEPLETE